MYECLSFKWSAVVWPGWEGKRGVAPAMATRRHIHLDVAWFSSTVLNIIILHTTILNRLKRKEGYAAKHDVSVHIDVLMQERCNSIANALELHLSCTNPSIYSLTDLLFHWNWKVITATTCHQTLHLIESWWPPTISSLSLGYWNSSIIVMLMTILYINNRIQSHYFYLYVLSVLQMHYLVQFNSSPPWGV